MTTTATNMIKLWECRCRQLFGQQGRTGPALSPPPTASQLAMARRIDEVLGHKYEVVPLPASTFPRQESFGIDKYKVVPPLASASASLIALPNRYRLTGHELTVTGFAKFHAFDVTVYADPPAVEVVGAYPHRGPLCGVYKMVAFCEVGPRTEERLIVINETLNDALEGGAIAYVASGGAAEREDGEEWADDGSHNHRGAASEGAKGSAAELVPSLLSSQKDLREEVDK